jgi:hypothetical protein
VRKRLSRDAAGFLEKEIWRNLSCSAGEDRLMSKGSLKLLTNKIGRGML